MSDNRLRGIVLFSVVTAACASLCAGNAQADSVRLRADLETVQSSTSVTNKLTGESIETDTSRNNQQYDFSLSKNIYPNLVFFGGSLYELTDTRSSSAGQEFESEESFLRPFARVSLNTPMYQAGAEYRHTRITSEFAGGDEEILYQDSYNSMLGWRPEDLPTLTLRYEQNYRTDAADTLDTLEKNLNLESSYTPVRGLQLYYFFRQEEGENRIFNTQTINQRHNGRIDYSHGFFQNRLNLSTGYQLLFDRQVSLSEEVIDTDIAPAAGLFSVDDTPEDGPALSVNNALIDGIRSVSAGIDIGLGGDETTLTNIGLDLGLPTKVDRILLWVDRRLTAAVASSFTWEIYTSPDNRNNSDWKRATTVSGANFGAFENRFEIVFPSVNTRFIKVVVRPLSPALPESVGFPNIFVTEIEPFSKAIRTELRNEQEQTDQNFNFGLTGRLSEKTSVGYDLFYRSRELDPITGADPDKSSEIANGVFLRHVFNSTFSSNARVQQTETEINEDRIVDLNYSASLRGDYMSAFNQIFTYAGTQTKADEDTGRSQSFFLRNNFQLYQGWSAFADLGRTMDEAASSERVDTSTLRLGTNVVPHQTLTMKLDHQWRLVESPEAERDRLTESDTNVQVFYVPFPALSFFGKYTYRDRADRRTTLQNYSVNWSPFPDGTLQCSLNFSETLAPEEDRLTRTYGPFVKWSISRHLLLETQYSVNISDTPTQEVDTQSFQVKLTFLW